MYKTVYRRVSVAVLALMCAGPAYAQNWAFDARKIGMGALGGAENPSTKMIEEESGYRAIVIPFGLFQILRDLDVFRPDTNKFDIVRSIEYAAAPVHYVVGRDNSPGSRQFVVDVRNATLSRDLNTYRGFVPADQPAAEGLAHPSFGGTIKVHRGRGGTFQGIYVGAGPYLSMGTDFGVDERLRTILASSTNVYVPNAQFPLSNTTLGQAALAVTGGYRARLGLAGPGYSDRDGLYLSVNYNYLRGFRYENIGTALRLDTDNTGLLTVNPLLPAPLRITRDYATKGNGYSVDVGVGTVVGPWEAGLGITGIGNRINWDSASRKQYSLTNILTGNSNLSSTAAVPLGSVRVELPVDYRAKLGYRTSMWTAAAEYGHGFNGNSLHAGYEYRLGVIDLRGGAIYARERWQPAGGFGLNMGRKIGIDVAFYGTSANAERVRRTAIAASLRINH